MLRKEEGGMNPDKSIKSSAIVTILRVPFIVLIALLTGLWATGQVKFTTIASSQEIGRADYLQVEFVVENAKQIDQMNPPEFPGFHVAQGPIQSSGMSIVNGNMSQYKALSFVLQPVKTGKFTIQGASAVVDGKRMQSNPVTIVVNAGSSSGANNSNNNNMFPQPAWPDPAPAEVDRDYILKPGENIKDKIKKNLFVKVQVNKTTCYVGEPIVATYKLYSRLSSESRVTKRPSLNGFSVYDMVDPNSDASSVEKLNGKAYTVHIIRKTQLIPLQPGTVDLDPVEVENTVHFVKGGNKQAGRSSGNSLKDLFDQLSDDNVMGPEVEENVTLDTKPLTITIKPLPEAGKPADFTGAVGDFSIQASLVKKNVTAQDDGSLRVVIRGKGNLPVINAPTVQWPSGVDAFDPAAKEDINKTTVPMSGSKTFDYVFTSRGPGHYTIPAIVFSYFDPASQSYKKAETDPLDLQVTGEAKKTAGAKTGMAASGSSATEEPFVMKRFIGQRLEWFLAILILSGVAVFLWRQNIRLKKAEQKKKELEKKANEEIIAEKQRRQAVPSSSTYPSTFGMPVIDPLQDAKKLFEEGDYKGFHREVNRAVWKAVASKVDLPTSELNKNRIARQLIARGWDTDTILSLENILNECEMNLYTPAYDANNMRQLLRQTESLLERLG